MVSRSQFCIALKSYVGSVSLLGGYVSIKVMLDTIRNTTVVRCREAVLFSEGPLSEVRVDCTLKSAASAIAGCVSVLPGVTSKSSNVEKANFLAWVKWLSMNSHSHVTDKFKISIITRNELTLSF